MYTRNFWNRFIFR